MGSPISPAKVILLAVHFAAHADVDSLSSLLRQYSAILHQELLLRILLTHLPETLPPSAYVPLLQHVANNGNNLEAHDRETTAHPPEADLSTFAVDDLSDEQATKRVRKLRLHKLDFPEASPSARQDPFILFLFQRAYKIDCESGMLDQLPDLLFPFLHRSPVLRQWTATTVFPYLRRNTHYYPHDPDPHSLLEFQQLPGRTAISCLLSQTGLREEDRGVIGRDLRELARPWVQGAERWQESTAHERNNDSIETSGSPSCDGWEQVIEWLVSQSAKSWQVAVDAVEQWGGPQDVDFGDVAEVTPLDKPKQQYLESRYARAALASAYLISDTNLQALDGAWRITNKIAPLLHATSTSAIAETAEALPDMLNSTATQLLGVKSGGFMRNQMLEASNILTKPDKASLVLLRALVLSAYLSSRLGVPCTIRTAGNLAFIQDQKEQTAVLAKLIRATSMNTPRTDDEYWMRARRQILWLRDWGQADTSPAAPGILGHVSKEHIESHILKALLSTSRYTLAKDLYDSSETVLATATIQSAIQETAMSAFDNSTNPNRTRGGLKKCDEIVHALPNTVGKSLPMRKRIEALIKATHALSDYRLVLKQGEPFSPVVMRVHSDPVSIIAKVLEQNVGAYTRLSEFLEMGIDMVRAGLPVQPGSGSNGASPQDMSKENVRVFIAEKRIVAMCIEAALKEDDFETAYSYVVSRLAPRNPSEQDTSPAEPGDEWSWNAALQAGQYIRTERSQQPTHLGTASGNLEIRHLEQRIECLATSLRVAPAAQLQEILKTFRRCEEQLDSAVKEEAAKEAAWDSAGAVNDLPGAFDAPDPTKAYPPRNITASAAARQAEESPMSLFDLSRATASVAQRNFTGLSSLHSVAQGFSQQYRQQQPVPEAGLEGSASERVRKRDQFRDAATGTLVSGVGWLIGANVNRSDGESQ